MTTNPINTRQEFLPDDVLKIEVETETDIKNLVVNPSGDLGAWGWSTANPDTTLSQVYGPRGRVLDSPVVYRHPPPSWPTGAIELRISGQHNDAEYIGITDNDYIPDGQYKVIVTQRTNLGGVTGWVTSFFIADWEPVATLTNIGTAKVEPPNELQFTKTATSPASNFRTSRFPVTPGQYMQARFNLTAITASTSIAPQLAYYDAEGVRLVTSHFNNVRNFTPGTVFFGAYQVPAGAVTGELIIHMYGSTATDTFAQATAGMYVCVNQVQVIQTATATTAQQRRNLALNPNFETSLNGVSSPVAGNTITRATDQKWKGSYSAKFAIGGSYRLHARFMRYSNGTVATDITKNTSYVLSFYARAGNSGRSVTVSIRLGTSATSTAGDYDLHKVVTFESANQWKRIDVPFNSGSKTKFKYMSVIGAQNGSTFWFDGFLLEAGSTVVRPYFDGSNSPEAGWTVSWYDAANASGSLATGPAAQFAYVPPVVYQDITGDIVSLTTQRAGLETGTMQLNMTEVRLDPSQSDVLRKGRRIKASAKVGGETHVIFTGKINNARVDYEPRPNKPLLTNIHVTAIDATADLANTKRANSVVDILELATLLEGQNVPWEINGDSSQTMQDPVTAGINENASLLDQIALTRDTPRYSTGEGPSYAFVSRDGILTIRSEQVQNEIEPLLLTEHDGFFFYNDQFKLSYDSDDCINEVLIKAQRLTGTGDGQQTEEWNYGPYKDNDSIAKWGSHSKEFTVATTPGVTISATYWDDFIADIFARNAEPKMLMSSVQVPVLNETAIAFAATLDLYSKLNITNDEVAYDEVQNIVGVNHTITASSWLVDIALAGETSVASPETQPDLSTYRDSNWSPSRLVGRDKNTTQGSAQASGTIYNVCTVTIPNPINGHTYSIQAQVTLQVATAGSAYSVVRIRHGSNANTGGSDISLNYMDHRVNGRPETVTLIGDFVYTGTTGAANYNVVLTAQANGSTSTHRGDNSAAWLKVYDEGIGS